MCPLLQQVLCHVGRRRFACISSVLLEGEAKHGDALACDGVEHGLEDLAREAQLLPVIDVHHFLPVLRHLRQAVALAQVHQVQDVLLEAATAKPNRGAQEVGTNTHVRPNSAGNFVNIGTRGFAQSRDGVNARNALREHGVGHQLRQLRGPQVRGDDLVLGHPSGIDGRQRHDGSVACLGLLPANQHTGGRAQVWDRSAFRQELGVGQNLKADPLLGRGAQHAAHGLGGLHGNS
mmetsp:Transcript_57290/g.79498  ORF Transcript_57290/g.79498 Transcript_57290/m.79498 type:complete len:234 (+) Transcript_57290:425-1126(+)